MGSELEFYGSMAALTILGLGFFLFLKWSGKKDEKKASAAYDKRHEKARLKYTGARKYRVLTTWPDYILEDIEQHNRIAIGRSVPHYREKWEILVAGDTISLSAGEDKVEYDHYYGSPGVQYSPFYLLVPVPYCGQ